MYLSSIYKQDGGVGRPFFVGWAPYIFCARADVHRSFAGRTRVVLVLIFLYSSIFLRSFGRTRCRQRGFGQAYFYLPFYLFVHVDLRRQVSDDSFFGRGIPTTVYYLDARTQAIHRHHCIFASFCSVGFYIQADRSDVVICKKHFCKTLA